MKKLMWKLNKHPLLEKQQYEKEKYQPQINNKTKHKNPNLKKNCIVYL